MPSPPVPVVPLNILYPNGRIEGVQIFVWDDATQQPLLWDGSVSFSGSLPSTVQGNLTNNNAAPAANNIGVLPAVANAAAPTWTEGRQVLLSTDLSGNLRVATTITGVATAANQTNASQKTQIVDGSGNVIGSTSNALNVNVASPIGQQLAAASVPVVLTAAQLSTLTPLSSVTVSGTVTANAGTNLNTSALALESGGNLATIAAAHISQEATTSGVKGLTVFGAVTTSAPTYTTLKSDALSLQTNGSLRTVVTDPLPAGTNVLGHVITDSGSTTAVTGSVTVAQTTATNLNAAVVGTGTAGSPAGNILTVQGVASMTKLLVTPDALPANQSVNVAQIAGNTTSTAASGVQLVGNADGSGNALTSNSTTYTSKHALDANILGTLGTAFSTAGKVDVKSADGDLSTVGTTTGAKVTTDATGTLQQYLRGLVYLAITQGAQFIVANDETSLLYNGATGLTPKWSIINASTSGANNQVSAVASHKIRVLALALTSNGTVNVKFQSHVTPTDKTGLFYEIANTGFVLPYNPKGWFETISGEALDINLSASVAVGGILQYVEV